MAYYDHGSAMYKKECKEKYEELLLKLKKSDDDNDYKIYKHLHQLEIEHEEMKKKIEKYQSFFKLLQELTPRGYSIYDPIG